METWENPDLEQNILGAMVIRGGEKIPVVLGMNLTAEDFTDERNRILFSHIVGQYLSGGDPERDRVTLIEEMKKAGDFDKVGAEYFMDVLHRTAYTNAYIEGHVRMLKEKTNKRKFIDLTETLNCQAKAGIKSIDDIIADASEKFSQLTADEEVSKFFVRGDFFTNYFDSEIENTKKYANRATGFKNIDEHQIFIPGLYVLGATPAAGKTSCAWQMADQLAKLGETCIFCSYEMGKLELFTKSVARELFKRDPTTRLTAAEIRRGGYNDEMRKIIEESRADSSDLRVLELHSETVDDLLKILRPICTKVKKSPVIFIDYLQIIPSTKDNTKSGIDDTVRKLKIFQRDTNTTFIVISSVNRQNYTQQLAFESFKESGNIEYTADVVWGLQLNILNEIKAGADISTNRKKIEEAKRQQPRQIQLKCLKNRLGADYDCYFRYFSAHDYFEPCDAFQPNSEVANKNADDD